MLQTGRRFALWSVGRRNYYLGNPFRLKTLTRSDVENHLKKRGIDVPSFRGRKELMVVLEDEIASKKLSVHDAADLMSFQDLNRELQLRNISPVGRESELRQKLLAVLEEEEKDPSIIPTQVVADVSSHFQQKESMGMSSFPKSLKNQSKINFDDIRVDNIEENQVISSRTQPTVHEYDRDEFQGSTQDRDFDTNLQVEEHIKPKTKKSEQEGGSKSFPFFNPWKNLSVWWFYLVIFLLIVMPVGDKKKELKQ